MVSNSPFSDYSWRKLYILTTRTCSSFNFLLRYESPFLRGNQLRGEVLRRGGFLNWTAVNRLRARGLDKFISFKTLICKMRNKNDNRSMISLANDLNKSSLESDLTLRCTNYESNKHYYMLHSSWKLCARLQWSAGKVKTNPFLWRHMN